jgi:hypothetical protein
MTLEIHFMGGPLDGAIIEGEESRTDDAGTYLATKVYFDARRGLVDASFELFDHLCL